MPAFTQDTLLEIIEATSTYSEQVVLRLIEAARDPDKSAQLVARIRDLYEEDNLDDFKTIALAIALGEARVTAAIPLLLESGADFDMGIFGDAAGYAIQRMALSADAAGEPTPSFDAAMALAESDTDPWIKIRAYELLEAARSATPALRQRIADFCLFRAPIELARRWNEEWTPALAVSKTLVAFRDQRVRPLLERQVAEKSAFADEFQAYIDSLDRETPESKTGDWLKPWQKICQELESILNRGSDGESDEDVDEKAEGDAANSDINAAQSKLVEEFGASQFAREITGVSPEEAADEMSYFLNSATKYIGLDARDLKATDLREMLFDILPRKFSSPIQFFQQLPLILHAFVRFLEAHGDLKGMTRRQQVFQIVDEAKTRLPALAADPRNWGMAKSMAMAGHEAGYDMTDPADARRFMVEYNARLATQRAQSALPPAEYADNYSPPAPLAPIRRQEPKIGRNDPCPCGSGKKYKKCCGTN